ncbi:membrane-associated protein, putative [Bodo saltans]|uniref:Membrane-associated protein, putative n=1 Tax=Bodo saltans TaxID=75058 RepID=A0A0S4J5X1_BODSA|nr:membrane-associated protein, putative [Bodo saltans]|eukprot:CUG86818.1 membrane-associated protein, putative [Bodo saltans]
MNGTLQITVVKANGLLDRDTFGHSDPYTIVLDPQGKELLKTNTIDDNCDPVWPAAKATTTWTVVMTSGSFRFQVFDEDVGEDEILGEGTLAVTEMIAMPRGERTLTLAARANETDKTVAKAKPGSLGSITISWIYTAPAGPPAPVPQPVNAAYPQAQAPPVAKAVNAANPQAAPVPQPVPGYPQPAPAAAYAPVPQAGYGTQVPQPVSQAGYGAPGPQAAKGYPAPAPVPGYGQPPYGQPPGAYPQAPPAPAAPQRGSIRIVVKRGESLANVDEGMFGGGASDPFCQVFDPAGREILKTPHVNNTLNPAWPEDRSSAVWKFTSTPSGLFKFLVWDDETAGGDQFMGEGLLDAAEFLRKPQGDIVIKLKNRVGETDKKILKANGNLGNIHISYALTVEPPTPANPVANNPAAQAALNASMASGQIPAGTKLRVFVRKGTKLLNRDGIGAGDSDPYVIGKDPSGKEVMRTKPVMDNLNPDFPVEQATIEWPVPPNQPTNGFFHFSVWDYDPVGGDDFLGEVFMNVQDMIRTKKGENAVPLKPRQNEPDKEIQDNAANLGTLTVQWDLVTDLGGSLAKSMSLATGATAQTPIAFPGNLSITIVRGAKLFNRETFGTSDPYVIAFGLDAKEVHRTPEVEGNLNPTFPTSKSQYMIRVESPQGMLKFHVMDKETISDNFMGEGVIDVNAIIAQRGGAEIEVPLQPRPNEPEKDIRNAKGLGSIFIKAEFEKAGVLKREADDGSRGLAMPNAPKKIPQRGLPGSVTVLVKGAIKLKNKETFGTSDPYCIVKGPAGDQLLKTTTIDACLNPEWPADKSKFVLRLTEAFFQGKLTFSVFDEETVKDRIMGEGSLPVAQILTQENGDVAIPLGAAGSGDEGYVIVNVQYAQDTAAAVQRVNVQLPGTVVLTIAKANGLMNQESFGTSDPYAKVLGPDAKEALKTPTSKSTLNPTWPPDKSKALIRVADRNGSFKIQVWDENVSSDEFMGEATIEAADLLSRPHGEITLSLRPRPTDGKALQQASSLGTVTFNYSYLPGGATDAQGRKLNLPKITGQGRMMLKVLSCANLIPMDFATSDPFIALVVDGRRVYKSKIIDSTVNPVWSGSDGTGDIYVRDASKPIFIEVYDHDATSGDDFEGKVQILPMQLDESGDSTMQLLDENMRADKNRGTITFQWAFTKETLRKNPQAPVITKPGRVTVTVESCASLISRSTFSDTPHVAGFYSGSEVFRTPKGSGLNPSWTAADATFTQYITNPNAPIELYAQEGEKFLGMCALLPADMNQQGNGTLTLLPRLQESDTTILEKQGNLGTISFKWVYEEAKEIKDAINKPGTIRLRVIGASGLISQDTFGEMEVYAEVHLRNKIIHRTKEVDYSMKKGSCEWNAGDGTHEVQIDDPSTEVLILLWDKDATSSDFLGRAVFRPTENAKSGEIEMVLRPRPNEQDSKVAKAQSLGHLRVSWLFTESQERIDVSTKQPGVVAPVPPAASTGPQGGPQYLYQNRAATDNMPPPPPPGGVRVRIRLSQVRGVRFVNTRQDPEVLVSLLYNAQELRTNPAVSDGRDATVFPLNGTFTITPKADDKIAFRVFDADDLWGRPLGIAYVKWEESLAANARSSHAQQSVFASPLVDERGEPRGEVLYMISAEDKSSSAGELEYEVRQAQDISGIPSGAHVMVRTAIGGVEQYSKPIAALSRTIFLGAKFKTSSFTESDVITVELMDAQSGAVYAGGTLSIGPERKDGNMWMQLIQPANKQNAGTVFVDWRFAPVTRRPLSEYVTCPDGSLLGIVEVLQVKGFDANDIHHSVAVQVEQNQQPIARSDTTPVVTNSVNIGHVFYAPVDVAQQAPASPQRSYNQSGYQQSNLSTHQPSTNASTILRLVETHSGHSIGEAAIPLGNPTEVESWVALSGGKHALVRTMVMRGQPVGGQEEKNLVVRVKRVEPSQHFNTQRDVVLSMQVNPDSGSYGGAPSLQRTAAFKPQGVQIIDSNYFFPAHLFPRTQKRFPLEVCLLEAGDATMGHGLGACSANISRLRRGGDLTLDMHDGTRVLLSYLWVDLAGTQIGDVPNVKTLTLVEANLRNNVTTRYESLIVQLSTGTGGAVVRSTPSGHPTPQNPRFGDQPFNIVEGAMTMPIRVTLIGVQQGKEESIGVADVTSESFAEGRQLLAVRRRADEVAAILFETTVTLSASDKNGSSVGIRRKGAAKGDESYPIKVQFVAGRAFGTRMEPHETLDALRPYLSRHFAVLEEEQQLTWNNKPLEWDRTVAQNKIRLGDDGVANFALSSTNKRNLYLNVKTPSGKAVVIGANPHTSVKQVKTQLTERDDTELDIEPVDGISLVCNRTELADDESLGFYRLQSGNTLFATLKPRSNKASKLRSLPPSATSGRVTLRVEGPYGDENIVQLSLDEPVAQLRGILSEEDNVRSDIFIDGQRILNEEERLGSLGVTRGTIVKFVLNKFRIGSPEKSRAGPTGSKIGSFDVEGVDGMVARHEFNFDEPISGIRRVVSNDPAAQIFYNGRMITNENRTFRDIEASPHGGHFQLRYPQSHGGERRHGTDHDLLIQRQRATESLQFAVVDLQRQLEASKASQNAEKQLSLRLMDSERELDEMHLRYENALSRIRELEDTIDRQQSLMQRMTSTSTTTSNPYFQPHVSLRNSSGSALPLRPIGGSLHLDSSGLGSTFYNSRH